MSSGRAWADWDRSRRARDPEYAERRRRHSRAWKDRNPDWWRRRYRPIDPVDPTQPSPFYRFRQENP